MREEERFSLFTKYIPETEFLVDSCSKFRSHVDNCRSMLLRRDHCSWKFHSLHFPTAVNRAIKLGISRTPSISLVTGARNGENETRHFGAAAKRRKICKTRPRHHRGKLANGCRLYPRDSERRRSRHYPIFRDAIPARAGYSGWRGRVTAIVRSLAARISHVQGCSCGCWRNIYTALTQRQFIDTSQLAITPQMSLRVMMMISDHRRRRGEAHSRAQKGHVRTI